MQTTRVHFKRRVSRKGTLSTNIILNFTSKFISIAPFIFVFYGALQLFIFSKKHSVVFIDLLKANIFLAFGATYLIFTVFMIGAVTITTVFDHSLSAFVNDAMIKKSKIDCFKKHPIIPVMLLSSALAIWPYVLLFPATGLISIGYIIAMIILLTCYHNFLTTDLPPNKLWRGKRLFTLLLLGSPVLTLLTVAIITGIFSEYIRTLQLSDIISVSVIFGILLFINFVSFYIPVTEKKKSNIPGSVLFIAGIGCYLFLLPNPLTGYTTDILARSIGIGPEKRCYLTREVNKLPVPDTLKKQKGEITELSVVANIDDVYYLTKPDDAINVKAQIRFEAEKLTRVGCPETKADAAAQN